MRLTLNEEAEHGDHGEAAVFDLLHLEQREVLGGGSDIEEVQRAAGVDGVEAGEIRALEGTLEGDEARGRIQLQGVGVGE